MKNDFEKMLHDLIRQKEIELKVNDPEFFKRHEEIMKQIENVKNPSGHND